MSLRLFATICFLLLLLTACTPPAGVYHTVQQGQTLFRISRAYDLDERYLARINGVEDPSQLRIGQRLFIPGAEKVKPLPVGLGAVSTDNSVTPAVHTSSAPSRQKTSAAAKVTSLPPSSSAKTPVEKLPGQTAGKGNFLWPLRGELIKDFGRSNNQTCNGVEISAPEGTPVLAAAAGKVTYSSNGIRGYGNLIIIKHDDSFFSIYAFNKKNLVAAGDFVSRGERIALSGSPPNGAAPCLHFEIRQGKEPVNPIFYLP